MTAQNFPSFAGLRSGVSVPYSGFHGGTSPSSNGFAKPGYNVTLEGAHFFSEYAGVGALVGVNIFEIDIEGLSEEYVHDYPSMSNVIIETQPYIANTYLGGFFFCAPINNTLISLTSKLMGGILWVRNPDYIYNYEYSHVATFSIGQFSEIQSKFVFYYGLGARVDITKNLGLNLDVDYIGSKFYFDYQYMNQNYKVLKKVSYISATIGLNYYFRTRF